MNFCIAAVEYWESVGFNTENWRKSINGEKALCHDKFAMALVNINGNTNVTTLNIDSDEFKHIIANEFTKDLSN